MYRARLLCTYAAEGKSLVACIDAGERLFLAIYIRYAERVWRGGRVWFVRAVLGLFCWHIGVPTGGIPKADAPHGARDLTVTLEMATGGLAAWGWRT